MIRRGIALGTIFTAMALSSGFADARVIAPRATPARVKLASTSVTKSVTQSGNYVVVVSVRAHKHAEQATIYLTGQAKRSVRAASSKSTNLSYTVSVTVKGKRKGKGKKGTGKVKSKGTKLTARAVSRKPGVRLSMTIKKASAGGGGAGGSGTGTSTKTPGTGSTSPSTPAVPAGQLVDPVTGACNPGACPYTNEVWSDEFNGPAGAPNAANWTLDSGGNCGTGYPGQATSTATTSTQNAAVNGNGQLAITVLKTGANSYSTAQLDSVGLQSFQYGSIQASIQVPNGQGLCSQFWALGDHANVDPTTGQPCGNVNTGWPSCGEIDMLEVPAFSYYPNDAYFDIHGQISSGPNCGSGCNFQQWQGEATPYTNLSSGYHTYGVVWSPNSITWTIDGFPVATTTPAVMQAYTNAHFSGSTATWESNNGKFHILLDLMAGGWPGNPPANETFPATMYVDWVRVYQ
jgi:beta-glucanase (GH16 family)